MCLQSMVTRKDTTVKSSIFIHYMNTPPSNDNEDVFDDDWDEYEENEWDWYDDLDIDDDEEYNSIYNGENQSGDRSW